MALPLFIVDAFTSEPFRGNPAAVCLLERPAEVAWMQSVAREMNLSETAFVWAESGHFRLRWFTPSVEVDLCGHATLASAHVLWESGTLPPDAPANFESLSGRLTCTRRVDPSGIPWIAMDFPAEPPYPIDDTQPLLDALHHPIIAEPPRKNRLDYLVELGDEQAVRDLQPDFGAIARLPGRAVIITAHSHNAGYQFVSRFFGPAVGVPEDPVTGSAHCALAPYWAEKLGRDELTGYQASARGGIVRTRVRGDRVVLSGQAVTILRGELGVSW